MTWISRKTVRANLATNLSSNYTSNLVQEVKDHQSLTGLIGGNKKNPLVVVTSSGSDRNESNAKKRGVKFFLQVHVFVLFDDEDDWTEEISEDRLDDIEQETAEIVDGLDTPGTRYIVRQSTITTLTLDEEYRHEIIPVEVIYRNDR